MIGVSSGNKLQPLPFSALVTSPAVINIPKYDQLVRFPAWIVAIRECDKPARIIAAIRGLLLKFSQGASLKILACFGVATGKHPLAGSLQAGFVITVLQQRSAIRAEQNNPADGLG